MIKVKREITIRVQFVTGLRKKYGDSDKISDDEYVVRICYSLKPLQGFLTWIHEVGGHVGSWVYANWIDERREHWFISGMEKAAARMWKKHRGGMI